MVFQPRDDARFVEAPGVATGGRVGLSEGLRLSRDEQVRAIGQMSLQDGFLEREQEVFEELGTLGHQGFTSLADMLEQEAGRVDLGAVGTASAALVAAGRRIGIGSAEVSLGVNALFGDDVPDYAQRALRRYDAQFGRLRDSPVGPRPDEISARSIFQDVARRAVGAVGAAEQADTTFLGDVGFFIGGMIGYFDPSSNPLGFVTAPLGGVGRSALTRIAAEGTVQAGVEGLIQATGGQETRRRLGLPSGLGPAALEIGAAFTFGAAFQGVGEGLGAAARRLFPTRPDNPERGTGHTPPEILAGLSPEARRVAEGLSAGRRAPSVREVQNALGIGRDDAVRIFDELEAAGAISGRDRLGRRRVRDFELDAPENPYGTSPMARERANADLQAVIGQIAAWDGPRPFEARPARTDLFGTAARLPDTGGADLRGNYERFVNGLDTIEDVAARTDPDLVDQWGRLSRRREGLRQELAEAVEQRGEARGMTLAQIDERIAALEAKLAAARPRLEKAGKRVHRQKIRRNMRGAEAELRELIEFRDAEMSTPVKFEESGAARFPTPTVREQRLRGELIAVDEKMRDLAPLYSRAMATARQEWGRTGPAPDYLDLLKDLETRGTRRTIDDTALAALNRAEEALKDAGVLYNPPLPRTSKEVAESVEALDEIIETELGAVKAAAVEEGAKEITLGGHLVALSDRITIPGRDGEGTRTVTIREALADIDLEDDVMGAFTSCRLS